MGHQFRYGVYSLLIDLDELPQIARRIPVFSHNRWNLVAFHDRDVGPRDGSDPKAWLIAAAADAGVDLTGGSVRLLVFPRILGYTFNPLTVWFGHDAAGDLRVILYEIHNTFGSAHSHLMVVPDRARGAAVPSHGFDKTLHVSPFFDRSGSYRIALTPPGDDYQVVIEYLDEEGRRLLTASQRGERSPLTTGRLLRQFFTKPLLTFKVIAGIHLEALRLWRKGAAYHPVPEPPAAPIEIGRMPSTPRSDLAAVR